jgi:hypothetical protein
MNQRGAGGRSYLARLDAAPADGRTLTFPEADVAGLERGARLLFFEVRGDGEAARGYATGWGEIDRLTAADGTVTVQLREYTALKRRVPFTDLRADPRRDRTAPVQPISLDVFNTVLSKSRR